MASNLAGGQPALAGSAKIRVGERAREGAGGERHSAACVGHGERGGGLRQRRERGEGERGRPQGGLKNLIHGPHVLVVGIG